MVSYDVASNTCQALVDGYLVGAFINMDIRLEVGPGRY